MSARENEDRRLAFTVDHEGVEYACERLVTGQRVLRQTIHVHRLGSKPDSASYGKTGHPPSSMESVARMIAYEIIRSHGL